MKYIEAPNEYFPGKNEMTVFLAGGITGCVDWQKTLVSLVSHLEHLVVYNPRRENFPINDPSAARAQIEWEWKYLRLSSLISFWFSSETAQPIVMLELGKQMRTQKPFILGIHPQFPRRQNVEIQVGLERTEVAIVYSLEDLTHQIVELYDRTMENAKETQKKKITKPIEQEPKPAYFENIT